MYLADRSRSCYRKTVTAPLPPKYRPHLQKAEWIALYSWVVSWYFFCISITAVLGGKTHPPHNKVYIWCFKTHHRDHQDLKKSNFNRRRCGASGRIFSMSGNLQYSDWAALSDTTNFTACFFHIGLCWKEEKAWGKAESAQREWLWCGNLSIFEA